MVVRALVTEVFEPLTPAKWRVAVKGEQPKSVEGLTHHYSTRHLSTVLLAAWDAHWMDERPREGLFSHCGPGTQSKSFLQVIVHSLSPSFSTGYSSHVNMASTATHQQSLHAQSTTVLLPERPSSPNVDHGAMIPGSVDMARPPHTSGPQACGRWQSRALGCSAS